MRHHNESYDSVYNSVSVHNKKQDKNKPSSKQTRELQATKKRRREANLPTTTKRRKTGVSELPHKDPRGTGLGVT